MTACREQILLEEATVFVAVSAGAWLGGGTQSCGHVHEHKVHEGNGRDQKQQRDDHRKLL